MSVIVYWEVMIKSMKGTLDVGDPRLVTTDRAIPRYASERFRVLA